MMNKRIHDTVTVVINAVMANLERSMQMLDASLKSDAESGSGMAADARYTLDVAREELSRLKDEKPECYDHAEERLTRLSAMLHCVAGSYDVKDSPASRWLASLPREVDSFSSLIETTEMEEVRHG
jgi:hypothetical protein